MKIHRVKTRFVNSYIVENEGRMFVVDIAARGEKYILGYIEKVLKRKIEDVVLVVCTHDHIDHIGGVRGLAKECNAKFGLPLAADSFYLKFSNDPSGSLFRLTTGIQESFQPRAWDMYLNMERGRMARTLPVKPTSSKLNLNEKQRKPDFRLIGNKLLSGFQDWRVIHTPGHTWDSCCYYHIPSKSLITGDTLLGSSRQGRLVMPAIYSNPLQMAKSLKKLKRLNPENVFPGHGSCFSGKNLLEHL